MYMVIYTPVPIAIPIHLYLHTSVYHQPKVLPMQLVSAKVRCCHHPHNWKSTKALLTHYAKALPFKVNLSHCS